MPEANCVVCMASTANRQCRRCVSACVCNACAFRLNKCPCCRAESIARPRLRLNILLLYIFVAYGVYRSTTHALELVTHKVYHSRIDCVIFLCIMYTSILWVPYMPTKIIWHKQPFLWG